MFVADGVYDYIHTLHSSINNIVKTSSAFLLAKRQATKQPYDLSSVG